LLHLHLIASLRPPGWGSLSACTTQRSVGARRALQSFRLRCSPRGVAAATTSSRNWLLVQSFKPAEVPPLLVLRSHFAVGHFLGCVVFLQRAALNTLSDQCVLSSSFAFLQSLAQRNLVCRPQPTDTSLGLSFPSALTGSEVHLHGRCQRPLRSASRVWLPSGRLTPSEPLPVLFHTSGALGIHPSELSPPGRYPPRFRGEEPTHRLTRRYSRRRNGGPAQRAAVSGL
jgi:hypothetical protein